MGAARLIAVGEVSSTAIPNADEGLPSGVRSSVCRGGPLPPRATAERGRTGRHGCGDGERTGGRASSRARVEGPWRRSTASGRVRCPLSPSTVAAPALAAVAVEVAALGCRFRSESDRWISLSLLPTRSTPSLPSSLPLCVADFGDAGAAARTGGVGRGAVRGGRVPLGVAWLRIGRVRGVVLVPVAGCRSRELVFSVGLGLGRAAGGEELRLLSRPLQAAVGQRCGAGPIRWCRSLVTGHGGCRVCLAVEPLGVIFAVCVVLAHSASHSPADSGSVGLALAAFTDSVVALPCGFGRAVPALSDPRRTYPPTCRTWAPPGLWSLAAVWGW